MEDPADARAIRLPKGMTVEALWEARQALVQNPTPEGLKHLARQIFDVQQYVAGERLVLDVMAADQDNLPLLLAGADLLANYTTRYDVVVAVLAKVLAALPHLSELKVFMAAALVAKGDVALGLRVFADIMQNHPEHHVAACEHLAVALLEVGYMQEGHTVLDTWFRDNKPVTAALLNNMGCVLQRLNRSEEALPWYRRALELQPDNAGTIMGYAVALFKAGHYAQGAPYYAGREGLVEDTVSWYRALPRMEKNTSLHGRKVILFQDQGLGDTLQFIRYLPMVLAQGALVTVVVPTGLVRLLTLSFPQAQVVAEKDFALQDGYDLGLPIPDLPFVMGLCTPADIIANIPYLSAPPADVARFAALLGAQRPRIGLVWAGSPHREVRYVEFVDQRRSINLHSMAPLAKVPNILFYNLQVGEKGIQAKTPPAGMKLVNHTNLLHDFDDTAALIANLDMVISVDTSVVHLAAALGKPVWMLSRFDQCWRWLSGRTDTPWYNHLRIYQQSEPLDWDAPINKVAVDLTKLEEMKRSKRK